MTAELQTSPLDAAFLQELEENAVKFAAGAGAVLLRYFKTALAVEYKSKGRHDPVTAADRESEEYLRSSISGAYPDHCILGEEGKDLVVANGEFLWVLDPLDGTTNFVNGLPFFTVSVGVLYRGEPVAAAIFAPTSGLLQEGVFHTHLGGPAYFNGQPLAVADNPEPEPSHLTSLPAHYWRRMRFSGRVRHSPGEVRALGSIALELALTACGTLQYAIFDYPKIWDVAAGVLLVKQAGGLALLQEKQRKPWQPLERFEPDSAPRPAPARAENFPPGGAEEASQVLSQLEGFRRWSGTIIVGNPEIAWRVAAAFRRPPRVLRRVGALIRRVRQLPLWRSNKHSGGLAR